MNRFDIFDIGVRIPDKIKRDFFFDRIVTFQNLEMSAIVTFCQESCFFLRS